MLVPAPKPPAAGSGWLYLAWGVLAFRDADGIARFSVSETGLVLLLLGRTVPETVTAALVGRPLADIVELPFPSSDGCMVGTAAALPDHIPFELDVPLLADVAIPSVDMPEAGRPAFRAVAPAGYASPNATGDGR